MKRQMFPKKIQPRVFERSQIHRKTTIIFAYKVLLQRRTALEISNSLLPQPSLTDLGNAKGDCLVKATLRLAFCLMAVQ